MFQHPPNPIWSARLEAGLSQLTLCVRARVSLSTLRNAERGIVTHATLTKLSRALGVSLDLLVATDDQVIHFHRDHRGPEDHPAIRRQFFARADSA